MKRIGIEFEASSPLKRVSGDRTIVKRQEAASSLLARAPAGRQTVVQRSHNFVPSPPTRFLCWGRGKGEGDDPAHLRKSCFLPRNVWRTTKRETLHSVTNGPPLRPLPRIA